MYSTARPEHDTSFGLVNLHRLVTDKAQVGFRIYRNADETVDQDHIEKVLKQMMESEEGQAVRSNAPKFQRLAKKNIADGGVSSTNLNKFVQHAADQLHPATALVDVQLLKT